MKQFENLSLPDSKITIAETIAGGFFKGEDGDCTDLPEFCRVAIASCPGEKSLIRTEVWLPKDWNGIFIGLGNGSMAGINNHVDMTIYVKQGYAVANTDLGTSRGKNSGAHNEDVWKDFGWRATHIMTELGKTVLRAYYGRKEEYAYFIGGSTGGQQSMSLAQRYPEDYDGIIAAVPALNRVSLHTYFLWNHRQLWKEGKPVISEAEAAMITDTAVEFFQARYDGEPGDDFVTFPYENEKTINEFLGFLKEKHPAFTEEQLAALQAVYQGPVHSKTGAQIHCGMPIGSEIYGGGLMSYQWPDSLNFYPFLWAFGEDYDINSFNFADDFDKLHEALAGQLNANRADLTAFCNRGGKLLGFSGSADPCVPYPEAMKYYNRVCEAMGGYEKVASFFRFFLMPGKDHNIGGRGDNMSWCDEARHDTLYALRNWVEKGIEPDCLVAAHVTKEDDGESIKFMRRVYPYQADKKEGAHYPISCAGRYLK